MPPLHWRVVRTKCLLLGNNLLPVKFSGCLRCTWPACTSNSSRQLKKLSRRPPMCLKGQQNGTGVTANTDIQAMHNFLMGGDFVGRFLSLLEAASLAAALVLQIAHLRRAQSRLEVAQGGSAPREHKQSQLIGGGTPSLSGPNMAMDGSIFFAVVALTLGFLLRLWNATRAKQREVDASLSASGAARLLRAEVLQNRQAAALTATERELHTMRVRMQTMSRDIQPALRQVQAESAVHAEALSKVAEKLESLDSQIADTQGLIGALHSASMKQLKLTVQALETAQQLGADHQNPAEAT